MILILRWLLNAAFLLLLSQILPGFEVASIYTAIVTAAVLGILNAIVRPILILLTLPINFLTLGLFTFVINAFIILFVSTFIKGFVVSGLGVAIVAAALLWLFSWATNLLLQEDDNFRTFWHIERKDDQGK